MAESLKPVPIGGFPSLTIKAAAAATGYSPDTITRWVRKFGIGRQMGPSSPWRVSVPALMMVVNCDQAALDAFRAGLVDDERVKPYLEKTEAA